MFYSSDRNKLVITAYKTQPQPYSNYLHNLAALAVQLKNLKNDLWSLEEEPCEHYVYVYLDPRKPGDYRYVCPSGKVVHFKFQPFYVGKGKGGRVDAHLEQARKREGTSGIHSHKLNTIWAIQRETGRHPMRKKTESVSTEWMAFALEIDLIAGIGRKTSEGPLTNGTDGGEGSTGLTVSAEMRARYSKRSERMWQNRTEEDRQLISVRQSKGLRRAWSKKSKEERAAVGKKVSKGNKETWKNKTEEDNKARQLKRVATEAARPQIECPHCKATNSRKGVMRAFHFDNCRFKGLNAEEVRIQLHGTQAERQELHRLRCKANAQRRPTVVCPHCQKTGKGPVMKKWHFDNCKRK